MKTNKKVQKNSVQKSEKENAVKVYKLLQCHCVKYHTNLIFIR